VCDGHTLRLIHSVVTRWKCLVIQHEVVPRSTDGSSTNRGHPIVTLSTNIRLKSPLKRPEIPLARLIIAPKIKAHLPKSHIHRCQQYTITDITQLKNISKLIRLPFPAAFLYCRICPSLDQSPPERVLVLSVRFCSCWFSLEQQRLVEVHGPDKASVHLDDSWCGTKGTTNPYPRIAT